MKKYNPVIFWGNDGNAKKSRKYQKTDSKTLLRVLSALFTESNFFWKRGFCLQLSPILTLAIVVKFVVYLTAPRQKLTKITWANFGHFTLF